jgi:hypothetical protein
MRDIFYDETKHVICDTLSTEGDAKAGGITLEYLLE